MEIIAVKREELNSKLAEELEHLPRGPRGSKQNELRLFYNMVRRRDLGRRPSTTAYESLLYCIDYLKQEDPSFIPIYDHSFFRE